MDHYTDAQKLLDSVWPEWKIISIIGAGTYGDVYEIGKGENVRAALKTISIAPEEHIDAEKASPGQYERIKKEYAEITGIFKNELMIMERLRHTPNIASMEDYTVIQDEDGISWHVLIRMELLRPMRTLIPMDEQKVIRLGIDICNALMVCQKEKIIHRDIKPGNILYSEYGDFKLGDFGIARVMDVNSGTLTRKTGTPLYMAPEVALGKTYDYRSDMYSLGMVMYVCLNEQKFPFIPLTKQIVNLDEREEAYRRRMKGEPLPMPVHASPELSEIICRACRSEPKERYADAAQMYEALISLRDKESGAKEKPHKNRYLMVAGFTLAFMLAGVCIGAWIQKLLIKGDINAVQDISNSLNVTISADRGGLSSKIRSVSIITLPTKTNYLIGDKLVTDGLMVKAECEDGSSFTASVDSDDIPEIMLSNSGTQTVTINWEGFEIEFSVTVSTPLNFEISGDWSHCIVTGTTSPEDEVIIIPAYYQGLPVREIAEGAFVDCSMSEVIIPDTVESIRCGAFYACRHLKRIDLPSSVKKIHVDDHVWVNGEGIWHPFDKCDSLNSITVSPENPVYHSEGNCIIETQAKKLILGLKNSIIPSDGSVEILGAACFQNTGLQNIVIPEGISEIEAHAFWKNDIHQLLLPSTLQTVDVLAFCYLGEDLESIEMAGDGTGDYYVTNNCLIRRSEKKLFLGCRNSVIPDDGQVLILGPSCMEKRGIESINLPDCITESSTFALSENEKLKHIVLPRSMTILASYFFNDCSSLESVVIPDTVTEIHKGAFTGCPSLKTIYYEGTEKQWKGVVIDESKNENLLEAEVVYEYRQKG